VSATLLSVGSVEVAVLCVVVFISSGRNHSDIAMMKLTTEIYCRIEQVNYLVPSDSGVRLLSGRKGLVFRLINNRPPTLLICHLILLNKYYRRVRLLRKYEITTFSCPFPRGEVFFPPKSIPHIPSGQ